MEEEFSGYERQIETFFLPVRQGGKIMPNDNSYPELTALDKKILKALQQDGRLTNAELAKTVGLSQSACWNHTRRLFETGVIKAVRAIIEPKAVDRETAVLVGVVLDRSTPETFEAFAKAARALPQVLECYLVAGDVDYFLKLRLRDLNAFNRFHGEKLIALPGVRQVRTFFVLDEIKSDGILPF
jgi:Lrp/AsnC family leucine-responsive transcriptional regulator